MDIIYANPLSRSLSQRIRIISFYQNTHIMYSMYMFVDNNITGDFLFVLFVSLRPSQHLFQLCRDGSSWVEPVLSKDLCVLVNGILQ